MRREPPEYRKFTVTLHVTAIVYAQDAQEASANAVASHDNWDDWDCEVQTVDPPAADDFARGGE